VSIALADLLDVEVKPLNAEHGEVKTLPTIVRIDEQTCIGCTLCIQACPVDAILGAAKQMHTVIESECTGCNLCIPPCPVDCIHIVEIQPTVRTWTAELPDVAYAAPHAR
jgi:electron transport complex protein RnfB